MWSVRLQSLPEYRRDARRSEQQGQGMDESTSLIPEYEKVQEGEVTY